MVPQNGSSSEQEIHPSLPGWGRKYAGYGICYYEAGRETEGFTSTRLIRTSLECVVCVVCPSRWEEGLNSSCDTHRWEACCACCFFMASAYDGEKYNSEAAGTYGTESTGCPDQACRWEDWVDCPVQFHLSIDAANSAFLCSDDSHLHFAIINECVQDGFNVLHRQLYLQRGI